MVSAQVAWSVCTCDGVVCSSRVSPSSSEGGRQDENNHRHGSGQDNLLGQLIRTAFQDTAAC